MKFTASSISSGLAIAVAITVLAFAGTHTSGVISGGECEKKRESCISSCSKQREQCDKNNPNNSDYCVKQDARCQKGCDDAWRKCSEKP